MASDPTAQNREAVGNFLKGLVPDNSPLGQSLSPEKIKADEERRLRMSQGGTASIPFADGMSAAVPTPTSTPVVAPAEAPVPVSELATIPTTPTSSISPVAPELQKQQMIAKQAAADDFSVEKAYNDELVKQQTLANSEDQKKQNELDTKYNNLLEELEKAKDQKVDPQGRFSNMGFWGKLGTVILAGLGGKGGAEVVQKLIERDVAAQEKNIQAGIGNVKERISLLQEMRGRFKDSATAREAAKASALSLAQLKLEEIAQRSRSELAKQNYMVDLEKLEVAKQDALGKVRQGMQAEQMSQQISASDPVTAGILKFPEKLQSALLEAKEVYDNTDAALKSIDQSFAATKDIGIGGKIPFTESKATVDAENAKIESAIRATMKGQGTIQESEIERLVAPLLPDPTKSKAINEIKRKKLKELLITKNSGQMNRLKNVGLVKSFPGQSASKTLTEK